MKNWKYILLYILLIFFSGCGLQKRTVDKQDIKTKFSDRSVIETERESDIIILPEPRSPKDRPKDTTITVTGERGSTVTTSYDKYGNKGAQVFVSPKEKEKRSNDIKEESEIRIKQIERSADIEVVNAVGKWMAITFIPIGFFFAVAFWAKR